MIDLKEFKLCNVCKEHKPRNRDHFHPHRQRPGVFHSTCKSCRKNKHLVRHYGLTSEQYEKLLKKQRGRCKICRRLPPGKKKLSVDHPHGEDAVRVRALLCDRCNTMVGYFENTPKLVKAVLRYIERWKAW